MNRFFLLMTISLLTSCDAFLEMVYVVENKSSDKVELFIPNHPIDGRFPSVYESKDTILILKSKEKIIVGARNKIGFPWGCKNIYKNSPGICGLKKIDSDTLMEIGCSNKEWKYKKGCSTLKIK